MYCFFFKHIILKGYLAHIAFYLKIILKILNGFSILVITDGRTKLLRNSKKFRKCISKIFL